jgi:hypothetical protein
VGLSDLADTDVRAVYVLLAPDLGIRSLVFFRIYFDEEGRADSHWKIPIEHLARIGASGPDLGNGPIRLVCRSRCPQPDVASSLWDPDMTPGNNHFQSVRRTVEENALKFRKKTVEPADEDLPVLHSTVLQSGPNEGQQQRIRLARMIREQRLRIKTLQSVHREALKDLRREHRLELKDISQETRDLEQQLERQRLTNEQLKNRLAERNEQYLDLQQQLDEVGDASESRDQASTAELVLLREQLERKQWELDQRNDDIVLMEQERHDLANREPPEESLLGQLKTGTVFLVAYHAGVGHMTLPYGEIDRYFENPVAYAAEKCALNEPAYRRWIAHYDDPTCQATVAGKPCGTPVLRVSQPSVFRPGVDDRCETHQP